MLSVPTPLFDYLKSSALPTVVFLIDLTSSTSIFTSLPLLSNNSLLFLTRGEPLLSCIQDNSLARFISWINRSRESIDDINVELNLIETTTQLAKKITVTWRRTLAKEGGRNCLVLTALCLPTLQSESGSSTSSIPMSRPIGMSSIMLSPEEERLDSRVENYYGDNKALIAAESKLRDLELLIDRSEVGLARLTLDGRLHWVNSGWRLMTAHPAELPLDQWASNIAEEDVERLISRWQYCMKNMERMEIQFKVKSGASVLAIVTPNNIDPTLATGWISNLTDVTQAMKVEESIKLLALEKEATKFAEARREDAEEQRRQQELLIDVTSHEIRNPISAVLQNAEVLRASLSVLRSTLTLVHERNGLPVGLSEKTLLQLDEDIEAVESISDCAMTQERVANDILGLAQIQLGKYTITSVPFRLISNLKTALRMFQSECKSKDIFMKLELGDAIGRLGHPAEISADPVRFSQVIINLISNAVRFTASSPIRNITLSVNLSYLEPRTDQPIICPDDSEFVPNATSPIFLYFSVTDTGPGMNPEQVGRIFERFQQASPLTHVESGGSGLGLWIARNLCELHSGRIDLISEEGSGSSFRGYIKAAFTESSLSNYQLPSPTASLLASPTLARLKPLRILVAEDNEINMRVLVRQLKGSGHDVCTAKDGREALEKLLDPESDDFDCCLMDVEMPLLNGIEATKSIRLFELGSNKKIRIVGLTGNARAAQIEGCLASGMDAVITKPYRLPNLLETLAGPNP